MAVWQSLTKATKIEEVCYEPPELILLEDEVCVEIDVERCYELHIINCQGMCCAMTWTQELF